MHYNLDVIIAVDYRIKSKKVTELTTAEKDYLDALNKEIKKIDKILSYTYL